jgi:hypothetical protein
VVKIIQGPTLAQVRMKTSTPKSDIYSLYKKELTAKDWLWQRKTALCCSWSKGSAH